MFTRIFQAHKTALLDKVESRKQRFSSHGRVFKARENTAGCASMVAYISVADVLA